MKLENVRTKQMLYEVSGVEHENEETFMTMHLSKERQQACEKVEPLLHGSPTPHFYEVVVSSEKKKLG